MSNSAERVKPPRIERKEAKYYDINEVNHLFALLENEPIKYRTIIHIIIFYRLRLGEATALEWSDINFDDETIRVSKQLQYLPERGIYEIKNAKTESGNRTIPIQSTLIEILKQYKKWQDDEKIKWGDKWVESHKLFTKENGALMYPEAPSKWFFQFIKRYNLPPLTFHQLRHTYGSLLIAQGVDVATVSKLMGHSNPAVTLKIYAHATKQQAKEAADALENLLIKKGN